MSADSTGRSPEAGTRHVEGGEALDSGASSASEGAPAAPAKTVTAAPPASVPDRAVWIDGRLCTGSAAALSVFDRGARDGEGLFETIRVYAGRPFLWKRHLERLVVSAAELGFPVPPSPVILERALAELLAAQRLEDAVVRLTVTRGIPGRRPTRAGCWVEAEPTSGRLWKRGPDHATAVFSKVPFEAGSLGRHKTTSRLAYHLAREEARAARADEALLSSPLGEVLEGAVSNVFAVIGGTVVTPPLTAAILPGITRAWTLAACRDLAIPVVEGPLSRSELERASEAFLTNAVQEIAPLASIEGRRLPERGVAERLGARYREAVAES
jgi:branched-chain amino acid aminotransferase